MSTDAVAVRIRARADADSKQIVDLVSQKLGGVQLSSQVTPAQGLTAKEIAILILIPYAVSVAAGLTVATIKERLDPAKEASDSILDLDVGTMPQKQSTKE